MKRSQALGFRPGLTRVTGSALIVVLCLTMLVSVGVLLMARTFIDQNRMNMRRRELWRAFNFAEAGIASIQNWAIYPTKYTLNTSLFAMVPGSLSATAGSNGLINTTGDFSTAYPSLYAAIHNAGSSGFVISDAMLEQLHEGRFATHDNRSLGKIEKIRLVAPSAGDPVTNDFKIFSTGITAQGIRREVLAYATLSPVLAIKIPAALISYKNLAVNGNAKIHWGEAWAKGNITMESQNQYSYLNNDTKAIWRTQGLINQWGGGWATGANNPDINLAMAFPNTMGVKSPWRMSSDQTNGHFYQNVPEAAFPGGWPAFEYTTFKKLALAHGRYYSTDAAGHLYKGGVETAANQVDFMTEFGHVDPNTVPYDLIFIDTINGSPTVDAPPAADGSNLATIDPGASGGLGLKAILYMAANFQANGTGSPPTVVGTDPNNNNQNLSKIFLDGVLIAAGWVDMGGNRSVYGSAVAMGGWKGSGTPDIWYNTTLGAGISLGNGNAGSPFRITLENNYGISDRPST